MIHSKYLQPISLLVALGALSGCAEDVNSEAVRTDGMYANFQAIAIGDGTTLTRAELRVGGKTGTYVQLTGEDKLVTSADDSSPQKMLRRSTGDRHRYEATHKTEAGGTVFNISYERGEIDTPAPDSNVTLPEPFALTLDNLNDGDEVIRGTDIGLSWDNETDGKVTWELEGNCVKGESGELDDNGGINLPANLIEVQNLDKGESCTVTITVERLNRGSIDSAFGEGGKIVAIQRRAVTIVSTPEEGEVSTGAGGAP